MPARIPAPPVRNRRARPASPPHLAWVFALQGANQNLSAFFSRKTEASYSPHRSRVLEALCQALNQTHTRFPGTQLEMHSAVAARPANPKSGQVSEVLCQEV